MADVSDAIVIYPNRILKAKARPVPIDSSSSLIQSIINWMSKVMHESNGMGLAAPQVGISWRMFITNPTGDPKNDEVFINPEIYDTSSEIEGMREGCLSIPLYNTIIERPTRISIHYTDLKGNRITAANISGIHARIFQHEYDHLDGRLINDKE